MDTPAQEIIEAFARFDRDDTGSVSVSDLKEALTTLGDKMSDEEFDQLVKDAGGGSSIDYKDFVNDMMKKLQKEQLAEQQGED